jgi:hypothetical protein
MILGTLEMLGLSRLFCDQGIIWFLDFVICVY